MALYSDMNGFPEAGFPVLADAEDRIVLNTLYYNPLKHLGYKIDVLGNCRLLGAVIMGGALSGVTTLSMAGALSGVTTIGADNTVTLSSATAPLTMTGANAVMLMTGINSAIGTDLQRVNKGFFNYLEVKNTPTVNGEPVALIADLVRKQDNLTFGIADTNTVRIDHNAVADNDYAKFTANGLEGRSYAEVLSDIGAQPAGTYSTDIHANITDLNAVSGTNTGDNAANTSIAATKLDDFATPDDNTDLNANTTNHGLAPKVVAPASGNLSVLGVANAETVRSEKLLLDSTAPSTQAFGDSAAAGSSLKAARVDHKHAMPSGVTAMAIWTALTGAYASANTFTFTGTDTDVNLIQHSLFTCTDSAGTTRRIGYIKSAVNNSGTITATVVTDSNLAANDKDFKVSYNRKVTDYQFLITIPGECIADASYSQGMFLTNLPANSYLLPVNAAVRTAAAGTGAALAFNVYKNTTALFSSAPDMTTNATLVEQRPTTNTLSAAETISVRILSSAGATNKASDFQAKLYIIPTLIYTAF